MRLPKPENFTKRHWDMMEEYCNGVGSRKIADKFKCHDGSIPPMLRCVGISSRPDGFACYTIAHEWVLKAREQFKAAKEKHYHVTTSPKS